MTARAGFGEIVLTRVQILFIQYMMQENPDFISDLLRDYPDGDTIAFPTTLGFQEDLREMWKERRNGQLHDGPA